MVSLLYEFLMKLSVNAIPDNSNYIGEIFHYTALKNIEPILLSSQNQIVLWASQFDCLNDISEGTIVEQCYRQVGIPQTSAGHGHRHRQNEDCLQPDRRPQPGQMGNKHPVSG